MGDRIPKAEAMLRARALREPRDGEPSAPSEADLSAVLSAPALPHRQPYQDEVWLKDWVKRGSDLASRIPVGVSRIPGGGMVTWRGTF